MPIERSVGDLDLVSDSAGAAVLAAVSRFTGEEIDGLLGHPGPTPNLPESLLARYRRGPQRQPWHQLKEVKDERDRYREAFRAVAGERDQYAETLRRLAKSADSLTRDKAKQALGGR